MNGNFIQRKKKEKKNGNNLIFNILWLNNPYFRGIIYSMFTQVIS